MKTASIVLTLSLLLFTKLSFGYALNYGFLDDTAGVYFTDKDWKMFYKSQSEALNHRKDGAKCSWRNPQSGSWGSFVPSHSIVKSGTHCRDLTIVNSANHRIGRSTLTFCKVHGDWKGL